MVILITFVLLALSIAIVAVFRMTRPSAPYVWLAAAGGALFSWISVLFWQLSLPWKFTLGQWSPASLFTSSPQLLANPLAWLYALALSALAAGVILTSPVRKSQNRMASWLGTLILTVLGLLAVLVDNPLGLVLAWMAIDLTDFGIAMRTRPAPALSRAAVLAFSFRAAGTALAMWASVLGASQGGSFLLEAAPQSAGIYLLLAAALRLGVLPLHLIYMNESSLRRGFGSVLRMTVAATSLLVLARVPASAVDPRWLLPMFVLAALTALYGGLKWFLAPDELNGRPYWVVGMGSLSLAAALGGSPAGAGAWGVALILFGGISFLYSAKQVWFTRIFVGLGVLMLALPFTLTASGWAMDLPVPWLLWPLLLSAHALLAGGYARHLIRPAETSLDELPSWAQAVYPLGMGLLALTIIAGGLWGWSGALNLGVWQAAVVSFVLYGAFVYLIVRLPQWSTVLASQTSARRTPAFLLLLGIFPRMIVSIYRLMGDLLIYISRLLEGDGGLLWTLLLLLLLGIFLRGR